jgi:hypothetical protein
MVFPSKGEVQLLNRVPARAKAKLRREYKAVEMREDSSVDLMEVSGEAEVGMNLKPGKKSTPRNELLYYSIPRARN